MKKFTLLLMSIILSIGYANAPGSLPQISTKENPKWYYIQVKGTDAVRSDRLMTSKEITYTLTDDPETTVVVNMVEGAYVLANSFEDFDSQLWRFEEDEGENTYKVINKLTGETFTQWNWTRSKFNEETANDEKIVLATTGKDVGDTPSTSFRISDSEIKPDGAAATAEEGFYFIVAETPADSENPSTHQGNSGWSFTVIFEGTSWGYGADSQYQFVEFDDVGLVVGADSVGFGYYKYDQTVTAKELSVLGMPSLGDNKITWDWDGDAFSVDEADGYNDQTGGKLLIYFDTENKANDKPYTGTLTVSAGDISHKVKLTGYIKEGSPIIESSGDDIHWYNLQYTKATGYFVQDMGAGNLLMGQLSLDGETDDDAQLWKFVKVGSDGTHGDKYQVINQYGHQISWDGNQGGFVAVANSNYTYSFLLRNSDGNWQLFCNEYEYTSNEELRYGASVYIYNSGSDYTLNSFRATTGTTADNAVMTFNYANDGIERTKTPTFSTLDNPEWYILRFNRAYVTKGIDRAFTNNGIDPSFETYPGITQEFTDATREDQHWILVGNKDDFKIVSRVEGMEIAAYQANTEAGETAENKTIMAYAGEGDSFSLIGTSAMNAWDVFDNTFQYASDYGYFNDFGGSNETPAAIGQYKIPDGGSGILFDLVKDVSIEDVEDTTTEGKDLGEVVGVSYYNVQGQALAGEPATGLFIKVTKYTRGVEAKKIIKR